MGKKWKQWETLSSWAPKSLQIMNADMKLKDTFSLDKPRQHIKKQRHHFGDKSSYSYGFSSSHVRMGEFNYKEGWAQKNWCFWTVVLEKTLESALDCKIKPVNSKRKSTLNIHWKNWCWSSNTLATWCKEPTCWKRTWCWERLRAGGEGDNRGWNGWITDSMDMSLSKLQEIVKDRKVWVCCSPWGSKELDMI